MATCLAAVLLLWLVLCLRPDDAPERPVVAAPSAEPGLEVLEERRLDDRRLELRLKSPALGAETGVRLLLPQGWPGDAARAWPQLWLLHGGLDGYTSWTAETDVAELTAGDDVIVVMPDGGRCGSYSDWRDGPAWETYHLKELLPLLERRYRASGRRAIAGYSMGGQGAMLYAAKGHFRAAASFSGALHILRPGVPQTVMLATSLACPGTDWKRIWGDPGDQRDTWAAHNPYDQADRLRGVELYVAAGEGDLVENLAREAARDFVARLRELDIPVSTHFGRGGHNHATWQAELRRARPMLLRALRQG